MKFKVGDKVKLDISNNKDLLIYISGKVFDASGLFEITRIDHSLAYTVLAMQDGREARLHEYEIYKIDNNAINRLLYPELREDGDCLV
jgi:hypothetical protein